MEAQIIKNIETHILSIAKLLVANPSDVRVATEKTERGHSFKIKVHEKDLGSVIGKEGKNIQAIRQIFRSYAAKNKIMIEINIIE